ncbi:MAG TPA: nucleotidyltransferase family protein [Solirubrobacterales bacterium]|nr:nucleotidyltransferase family protein [Solirubrobacterales bacterium]
MAKTTKSGSDLDPLLQTLKRAAAALEAERIPFLLGGGLGCWARGGPPSSKDIDLMIKREDAERALQTLAAAGMRPEKPPEQWLYKAWDGEVMIDLIFEPAGIRITDAVIERGEEWNAAGMPVPVMALDDILATKLMALDEHNADYGDLLPIARALREQIDWPVLRDRTSTSPFAAAFFALAEGLGIAPSSFARAEPG